ncbi:hypothetical protein CMV_029518 [Castanea mollissima]|uniref:Uncharacterized protein n=1 Tax=Castanea mollissima TaxID=60419 RepID=A0A8J4QEC8_9ROSI|nr:hypothetical protein CMV_029518 [Castanea mollissima]
MVLSFLLQRDVCLVRINIFWLPKLIRFFPYWQIDLVGEAELEVLTKKIKHINGIAQIKLAKFGSVDMDFVLGVGGYDLERFDSEAQLDPYISLERCMCSSPDPCSFLSLAFKVKRK